MRLTPARALGALYRRLVPLPDDLAPARREMMRRIETRVWGAMALSLLVGWGTRVLIGQTAHDLGSATVAHLAAALVPALPVALLIMRYAFGRNVALWRQEARAARLDGALLVARTAAHRLNNTLAPVVGYAELLTLTAGARSDPTARAYAERIFAAAEQAAAEVELLQRLVRLEEDPTSPIALLDLAASTAADAGAADDAAGATGRPPAARQSRQMPAPAGT